MRDSFRGVRWLSFLMALGLLLIPAACEDDDDDDQGHNEAPIIEPASVKISAAVEGEVVFTVRRGKPDYAWSLLNPALGTLVEAGDTAIYKSAPLAGVNIITVTDERSNAISATITQL